MPDRITLVLEDTFRDHTFSKLILAKNQIPQDSLQKITIRKVDIKNEQQLSFLYTHKTQDKTENYSLQTAVTIVEGLLADCFQEAYLHTAKQEHTWKRSKKGKISFFSKTNTSASQQESTAHNKQKNYLVPADRPYLKALKISSSAGHVFDKSQAKYRQVNKYIEILHKLIQPIAKKPLKIVDMGSGKGYLTFALYDHLVNTMKKEVTLTGIELRENLVSQTQTIAQDLNFSNLSFLSKDISDVDADDMDIIIALHACDIATDLAIAKGIHSNADLIVCAPCCHKQIRQQMKSTAQSSPITKYGILLERQAELVTDAIRALYLEKAGYKTNVFEFISSEHTAKNVMITAVRRKTPLNNQATLEKNIAELKELHNIEWHALERML